jgi:hypothetical protein
MTGIASKLVRGCGCVVHTAEDCTTTTERCGTKRCETGPLPVEVRPGAVTSLAADLAAIRRALGVDDDALVEAIVCAVLEMRQENRELSARLSDAMQADKTASARQIANQAALIRRKDDEYRALWAELQDTRNESPAWIDRIREDATQYWWQAFAAAWELIGLRRAFHAYTGSKTTLTVISALAKKNRMRLDIKRTQRAVKLRNAELSSARGFAGACQQRNAQLVSALRCVGHDYRRAEHRVGCETCRKLMEDSFAPSHAIAAISRHQLLCTRCAGTLPDEGPPPSCFICNAPSTAMTPTCNSCAGGDA